MSTFSGLSAALSSLYAQRRGMDVTGQNIANANTDGYSRQRMELASVGAPAVPAMFARSDGTAGGVDITGVRRIRDEFLETRGRIEHAQSAYLADQKQVYSRIEQVFGEPGDMGLQSQLTEFWSAMDDLANRPGDDAARTQVLERGRTVSASLGVMWGTLASLFTSTREQLDVYTTDVNATAARVAQLNQAVVRGIQANQPINELADQRDQLVMKLVELTGATALHRDDGSVTVLLGGSSLVNGNVVRTISASGALRLDDVGISPVVVNWDDNGASAVVPGGTMASVLQSLNSILPGQGAALDQVASSLATTVNTQHALGFDLAGVAGGVFFNGTTAATITVAITDPTKIAAAGTSTPGGNLDGANADALARLANIATGPDRTYRQAVVSLGVVTQTINRRSDIQGAVTTDVDAARQAHSGVNLDEEMTNMITYERAYQAAARVITTVDEMLDTLINRTGLIGR